MGQRKITKESRNYFELDANKNIQRKISLIVKAVPKRKLIGVNIMHMKGLKSIIYISILINRRKEQIKPRLCTLKGNKYKRKQIK